MTFLQFLGTCEISLLYMFVGLGVFITFRLLNFPDLSVDGTFTLGAALSAWVALRYEAPFLSLLTAFLGGSSMGALTALLHLRFAIAPLMAGIIVMTGLYSVNMRIMEGPNVSILGMDTFFSSSLEVKLAGLAFFLLIIFLLLYGFLRTRAGLGLRATGDNRECASSQGLPVDFLTIVGVALSNGLVAVGGALFLQTQGFADINMGIGTIIVALAGLMIGESFLFKRSVFLMLLSACLGTFLYRCLVAEALNLHALALSASDLNILTAFFVAVAFAYGNRRDKKRRRRC